MKRGNPKFKISKGEYNIILNVWLNAMIIGSMLQIYQNYKENVKNR